jgi:3-oxoacyl-[acyl-carrier-protein] synthase III
MVDTSNEWILDRTGIRERHIADPDMATSDMAVHASRMALADAGVEPAELDAIIVCTVTPDRRPRVSSSIASGRAGRGDSI